ncbi:hypothetical protein [Paenibacillus harenae]|uniref:hypothetical protein n=1 Tax=Paenibacillus harenae TaxID=306543 RepID=UPI00278E9674|nr:hypothetical protein [Paenibacillus harenae]MDQ0060409.1 hypothetical protein [Paenibacillus harenae]
MELVNLRYGINPHQKKAKLYSTKNLSLKILTCFYRTTMALVQTELQRFALRWYCVAEFKYILENVGFSNVKICAEFEDGKKPTSGNQKFVYQAANL